ncbi:MAG: cytochrome-c peroxidase [Nitrospinales bacterium]
MTRTIAVEQDGHAAAGTGNTMMRQWLESGKRLAAAVVAAVFLLAGAAAWAGAAPEETYMPEIPLGLEEDNFFVPKDNPLTKEKIELGRFLFFDKRLSRNSSIACATCHIPALAFTDGQPVSMGIDRRRGGRSAPTAINRAFSKAQFWDGRAPSLEAQSIGPLINPVEHGFPDHDAAVARLNTIEGYKKLFKEVFGTGITIENVGKAIASFQRTLISGNSPFDRYDRELEETISEAAKRGRKLFFGKARCNLCHFGSNFSDEKFHNLGIGWDGDMVDLGRYAVTRDPKDIGAFKTPTLREISRTAPYMNDGRFGTLEEVVEFYNQGGIKNPFQDNQIIPLKLTESEKRDLVEMLRTLNGEGWQNVKAPTSFPK